MADRRPIGRPRTSDAVILDGARRALMRDPRASMAEIARSAGVGMSAIYLRFPDRTALLQRIAEDGNAMFATVIEGASAQVDTDPAAALTELVLAVNRDGFLRLWLTVAGSFDRSEKDIAESWRLRRIGEDFVARAQAAGVLRPGITWEDLGKVWEALSVIEGADEQRTELLRERMAQILIHGLAGSEPLGSTAPHSTDFAENRRG